jgi:uncharacterized protein (TIGR03083 family)
VGTRPLRQYYEPVTVELDGELRAQVEPWVRHRRRLVDALGALDDAQWEETTRCTAWDARGVIGHLVVVDQFWMTTMGSAQRGDAPTRFIEGFDPSTGTDALVAPLLDQSPAVALEQLAAGTDAFVALVESIDGDEWDRLGEAPFGHMPAHLLLAHAHWDSWLHERDILEPLGLAGPVEPDDLRNATVYTFVVGGLQGGLLGDATPNGPGPDRPVDASVTFDDLPLALHVRYDDAVHISVADAERATAAGDALTMVESLAGRGPARPVGVLPADLDAQLTRAVQIL